MSWPIQLQYTSYDRFLLQRGLISFTLLYRTSAWQASLHREQDQHSLRQLKDQQNFKRSFDAGWR